MFKKVVLGLVMVLCLANFAFAKIQVDYEESGFLSTIYQFEEPQLQSIPDYDSYVLSIQWGSKKIKK